MTPKERATRSAEAMWANDQASKWFGMDLVDVDEGRAVLTLTVGDHHCNGHGICHGGVTHALADSAFAFACNSRNVATVGQHTMMSYLAPGKKGDLLTATATEVAVTGRSGIYDVRVTNQDNTLIAEFRGMSRAVGGQNFQE
ncbi:hydroxyphenylacetyl-CoA thioesterase PaaI [Ruegeria sp. HKCCD6228]|uniref:hydroxyphenylacetyl-CoA thioesterase PaaI n=1 Tax=Ruegeria TaxID=97050 RepID=UPI00147E8DD6|nr:MULTISPECIES: hydroxyphenylacetyl-CoA thioesterase PaaI [Ruegeria]NOC82985.1 hydroxyphenylacetyl-CoA thioesterase PaaI [Ruegeria sp. HKCCD6428]NOD97788.1 hydroxyphenylacetyl-CoA thioesterase PaaI [Ruegeria sp. HKCCD6228]UUV08472.1 hydroxyphenylacetyl-CoA thioesterase PaaI [Ruegeria sp. YS9]